jgi:hypothetical protein
MRAKFSADAVIVTVVFDAVAFALIVNVLVDAVPVLLNATIVVPAGMPVPVMY